MEARSAAPDALLALRRVACGAEDAVCKCAATVLSLAALPAFFVARLRGEDGSFLPVSTEGDRVRCVTVLRESGNMYVCAIERQRAATKQPRTSGRMKYVPHLFLPDREAILKGVIASVIDGCRRSFFVECSPGV